MNLQQALDELYGAPLADFIALRDRLAKALPALKAEKKPPLSVWLVNRVYRDERKLFDELLAFGKRPKGSFAAQRAEQAALIARVKDAAQRALGEKLTATVLQRFETTLHTLSALGTFAPDAPGQLRADREAVGFEAAFAAAGGVAGPVVQKADERDARKRSEAEERDARKRSEAEERDARKRAQAEAAEARKLAAEAERAAREREAELARERLAREKRRLALTTELEKARATHTRVQRQLALLDAEIAQLQNDLSALSED